MSLFEVVGMLTVGFVVALFIALIVWGVIGAISEYRFDKLKEKLDEYKEEIERLKADLSEYTDDGVEQEDDDDDEADEEADG